MDSEAHYLTQLRSDGFASGPPTSVTVFSCRDSTLLQKGFNSSLHFSGLLHCLSKLMIQALQDTFGPKIFGTFTLIKAVEDKEGTSNLVATINSAALPRFVTSVMFSEGTNPNQPRCSGCNKVAK